MALTQAQATTLTARPTSSEDQVCIACGATFTDTGARVQHIWDNRDDEFEYHGNEQDIAAQQEFDA